MGVAPGRTSIAPDHLQQLRQQAIEHYHAGRLAEAESAYRQLLAADERRAEGRIELGVVLQSQGKTAQAIEQYQLALRIQPSLPDGWNNLGVSLRDAQRHDEALQAFARALALRPESREAMLNLGSLLQGLGRFPEAEGHLRRAVSLWADDTVALNALSEVLLRQRRPAEAVDFLRRAVSLQPDLVPARINLGSALAEFGRPQEAIEQYRTVLQLSESDAPATYNLAVLLQQQGETDEAIPMHLRASRLRPDYFPGLANLAVLLRFAGRRDESIEYHRRALAIRADVTLADNLLLLLQSHPACDARLLKEELELWNQQYARPLESTIRPHARPTAVSGARPLRVAFVSPYLDSHPVGRFLLPLFEQHDRSQLEIVCYSDLAGGDRTTAALRSHTALWRDTSTLSHEQLADVIRGDTIDILVDLSMHTRNNRLLTFARKPAPVQATYLAYCGSTGLQAIDYRLSDPYLDPDDSDQKYYSEKTVRLRSYWCYPEPAEAPPVNSLPASEAGHLTFGCLNDALKYNEVMLATWIQALKELPGSRLVVHAPNKADRLRIEGQIAAGGMDPQRVECIPMLPMAHYFRRYHRIDLALDPTPWPGGTTTCDALWMGVPVVSVVGKTALSRGGLCILSNLGLPELVGRDPADQARIAIGLARDLPRLSGLRSSLRERMRQSPLMDAPGFARDFEAVLRRMWSDWCAGTRGS